MLERALVVDIPIYPMDLLKITTQNSYLILHIFPPNTFIQANTLIFLAQLSTQYAYSGQYGY